MSLYHPVSIQCPLSKEKFEVLLEGNLFLAPVAGYSDRAFRTLCADGGANFSYTEMVSAEALVRGSGKTEQIMMRAENEKKYAVQIFGSNPNTMSDAVPIVLNKSKPDVIDINSGCPVHKITKTGAGSALMKEPEVLYNVVKAVVQRALEAPSIHNHYKNPIPVTVKIRSGWDAKSLFWKEAALAVKEAGAGAITIHPRTRAQGYEGFSDWQILSDLVILMQNQVDPIPVFGSGDVFSPEAAKNMLEQTKCDAVMFARGAMGAPFIFSQTKDLLTKGSYETIPFETCIRAGLKELRILCEDKGENLACREMRKRFCAYTKGMEGGSALRKSIVQAESITEYESIFNPLLLN